MDYAELIKQLRYCANGDPICDATEVCQFYDQRDEETGDYRCVERMMEKAADAIEDLLQKLSAYEERTKLRFVKNDDGTTEMLFETQWIPVTERLPEDLQNVLVVDEGCVTIGHCEHYYGEEEVYVEWHDTLYYLIDPTFWMPLPTPPKEETE